MKHIMLDIEGLGKTHPFVIPSIGAVEFCPKTGGISLEFYRNIDIKEQSEKYGLNMDADTVCWWLNQSEEAQDALFTPKPVPLFLALSDLNSFFRTVRGRRGCPPLSIWCHATYDAVAVQSVYRKINMTPNPSYREWRDLRTLQSLVPWPKFNRRGTHHNALDDAKHQVQYVVHAFEKLGLAQ